MVAEGDVAGLMRIRIAYDANTRRGARGGGGEEGAREEVCLYIGVVGSGDESEALRARAWDNRILCLCLCLSW